MSDKPVIFVLDAAVSAMRYRLAKDAIIKEAEAMGFEFDIKLPPNSGKYLGDTS